MKDIPEAKPNWNVECQVCGVKPTMDDTKLCGVCTFGEADMIDWYEHNKKGKYGET